MKSGLSSKSPGVRQDGVNPSFLALNDSAKSPLFNDVGFNVVSITGRAGQAKNWTQMLGKVVKKVFPFQGFQISQFPADFHVFAFHASSRFSATSAYSHFGKNSITLGKKGKNLTDQNTRNHILYS